MSKMDKAMRMAKKRFKGALGENPSPEMEAKMKSMLKNLVSGKTTPDKLLGKATKLDKMIRKKKARELTLDD